MINTLPGNFCIRRSSGFYGIFCLPFFLIPMKKFFLSFAVFLLFSCSTFVAFAGTFSDVSEGHKNFAAIESLYERGIINGYEDGSFGPDNLVNRAEALKIIVGAFGIDYDGDYENVFTDVVDGDWFFPFVMGGYHSKIIGGYDDGSFKPGNNVNLAELLKIIVLAAGVELPGSVDGSIFADVPNDFWYAPHALYARNHNIVLPDKYGNLYADQFMTRAAFSEVVYRMIRVLEDNGNTFPLWDSWPTYEGSNLPFKIKYGDGWQIIENRNEVVFAWFDDDFSQFSPWRIYPNSAVLAVTLDTNDSGLSQSNYFSNIKTVFAGAGYAEFSLQGMSVLEVLYPEKKIVDWYVYLGNGDVLVVYTEFGNGTAGYLLKQLIKSMLSTFEYVDKDYYGGDYSALLSEIFGNLLHEGKGMEMLDKLPEKIIIETDTIGVGTGPIDYYYSEMANYTFKYERSADMIMDTREGKTTAF